MQCVGLQRSYSISKQTSHPTAPRLNILPPSAEHTLALPFAMKFIYFRVCPFGGLSAATTTYDPTPPSHGRVAIAKKPLKLCRCPMLLHSDENDKRLLNRQHRPTSSSLPQQVCSWKIIRIRIRIRFGNWCTQHAEKVNSYVLFKVRFTLQIVHSERKALTEQSFFANLVVEHRCSILCVNTLQTSKQYRYYRGSIFRGFIF